MRFQFASRFVESIISLDSLDFIRRRAQPEIVGAFAARAIFQQIHIDNLSLSISALLIFFVFVSSSFVAAAQAITVAVALRI